MVIGRPMTRSRIPFFVPVCTLLLAAGCATTQSQGASGAEATAAKAKGPTQAFKFDWPSGAKMKLTVHRTQTTEGGGKTNTWDGTSAMLLTVERQKAGGMVVHSSDQASEGNPKAPFPELLARVATTTLPSLVISPAGDLDRIDGVRQILDLYANAAGIDLSKVPPAQMQQIDAAVQKAMHSTASDLWNNMVAFWAGRVAPVGQKITKKNLVPIPALGGGRVTMNLDYQVLGKVPCVAGETKADCVQVELDSHPDATEVHQLLDQQLKQAEAQAAAEAKAAAEAAAKAKADAGAAPTEGTPKAGADQAKAGADQAKAGADQAKAGADQAAGAAAEPAKPQLTKPVMIGLSNTVHIVLITDPQTLLPYTLVKTRDTEVTTRMPTGQDEVQKQHEKITYTFAHGAAAVAPKPMAAPAPKTPAPPADGAAKPADGTPAPAGAAAKQPATGSKS